MKTGTLKELISRCAEGKLLGALPHCPRCKGGKLRFNVKNGEYSCDGYLDKHGKQVNCVYVTWTAKRLTWLD